MFGRETVCCRPEAGWCPIAGKAFRRLASGETAGSGARMTPLPRMPSPRTALSSTMASAHTVKGCPRCKECGWLFRQQLNAYDDVDRASL